ncbi:MAG TPA: hypothetical protein VKE93_07980, partial [Candidatus Angelobacter sp.]|nr:hypothetical protein [Candidatus Angelobacter sp.]
IGVGRAKISTSVDLPLSSASKEVLTHAGEEAERQGSKWIGLQHLTMGLLREGDATSEILKRHGITFEKLQGVRAAEGTTMRWPAAGSTVVPVEFVYDSKPVGRTDVTVAMPWPRIGETIVLGKDERAQVYTVVDIRHFYADLEGTPENKPVHVQRIVVTLQPSKPSQ